MKGFKKYILENHPDPDTLLVENNDIFEQMCLLAEGYAMEHHQHKLKQPNEVVEEERKKKILMFSNFLLDEGITIKSESENYSMDYLYDVWSGENPDGLL